MRIRQQRRWGVWAVAAGLGLLTACAGDRDRGGTLVIATGGEPTDGGLLPLTAATTVAAEINEQIFLRLASIGQDLNTLSDRGWTPGLASRWEWSADSGAITFTLDARHRWHDGHPVRAEDVAFAFRVNTDPRSGARDGDDIARVADSLVVNDSLTVTVWFRDRSPERFYTLVQNLVPLPAHVLGQLPVDSLASSAFAREPLGNGPFRFVRWVDGERLEIAAVDNFPGGRPHLDRVIWLFFSNATAALQRLLSNEADVFAATLEPSQRALVASAPHLRTSAVGTNSVTLALFNHRSGATDAPHPLFAERELRRALTMAIDRSAIAANVAGELGRAARGHFASVLWAADTTIEQIPYDPAAAARLLDSLGWTAGPDAVRRKAGRPLEFSLVAQATSEMGSRAATIMQEQLRQVGVTARAESLERPELGARMRVLNFDMLVLGIGFAPSPAGVAEAWLSPSLNAGARLAVGRYSNPDVDAQILRALSAQQQDAARAEYRKAYQMLVDDAAAIWLFETTQVIVTNARVQVEPGHRHAWYTALRNWRVTGEAPPAAAASADTATTQQ